MRHVERWSGCVEISGDELGIGDLVVIGSGIGSMGGMGSMGMDSVMDSLGEVGEVHCEFLSVVWNVEFL